MRDHADPSSLDTLALAYHMTGDTMMAIEMERRAIALLDDDQAELRSELQEQLARFEAVIADTDDAEMD